MLGLATKRTAAKPHYDRDDETGMVFEGFLLFFDPLKDGIEPRCGNSSGSASPSRSSPATTGTWPRTSRRRSASTPRACLTGEELNAMRDEALWHLAETTDVFAEVDPQQKERIVRALQHRGTRSRYLGDGINDAPALHAADVGVSVDQAVDVARETADIVLLRARSAACCGRASTTAGAPSPTR